MRRGWITGFDCERRSAAGIGGGAGDEALGRSRGMTRWSAGRQMGWPCAAMDGWRRGRRSLCSIRRAGIMCGRVTADAAGKGYVGMGGTASGGAVVMKVAAAGTATDAGKATKVFESKELGVQALRVGGDGRVYAVTSPDGKVYRLGAGAGSGSGDAVVVFDPAQTEEKPKYLWDVAVKVGTAGKGDDLYVRDRWRRRCCTGCRGVGGRLRWCSRRRTSIFGAC